jgi:hypothetical protein
VHWIFSGNFVTIVGYYPVIYQAIESEGITLFLENHGIHETFTHFYFVLLV